MERKRVTGAWSVKAAEGSREATAVIARFDRGPDADGDIYDPRAFTDFEPVVISPWGHSSMGAEPPVGKGVVRAYGDRAEVEATFFSTAAGVDAHRMLRELGELAEWSYGYDVLDSEPDVHNGRQVRRLKQLRVYEASPVWRGAGVGTGTVSVGGPKADPERLELLKIKLDLLRAKRDQMVREELEEIQARQVLVEVRRQLVAMR